MPAFRQKVEMEQGKVSRVWTNGVELKGSPDWITNDLNTRIKSVIHYDIDKNRNSYFPLHKHRQILKKSGNSYNGV